MEKLSNRIRAYRESNGITQREMAERMGVSSNYVYLIESERQKPSPSLVMLFERMEKDAIQSPQDFKTRLRLWRERAGHAEKQAAAVLGIGVAKYKEIEAGRSPSATARAKFEELEHASPSVMEDIAEYKYDRLREEARTAGGLRTNAAHYHEGRLKKVRKVPVIGWTQAGEAVAFEDVVDWDNVVSLEIDNPNAIAIRVKGDSMMPLIAEGDLVVVSPGDEPANEKYVVAKLAGDGVVCKQFRRVSPQRYELRSLNPFYQPLIVEATEVVWIYPVAQLIKTSL